ncbi:MAG: sodium:proton antiporter [Acidimicrobiales bacterium]
MIELILARYVYFLVVVLLALGLYGMLARRNLVKKILGMIIFQTAIYLFFIEGSVKDGATAPVIDPSIGTDPADYVNPLPHLLILTAIVVGVGVVGVAFALLMRIHQAHGTLDEEEILAQLSARDRTEDDDPTPGEDR